MGVVARAMGQLWSSLDEEEKAVYQQRSTEERARVAEELEKYKDLPDHVLYGAGNHHNSSNNNTASSLSLPLARMRKIVKLDPEVKGVSKEAMLLITKCTELATVKLGMESVKVAQLQNRRKLLPDDVAHVCATREQFLFLREDVRDLQKEQAAAVKHGKTTTTTAESSSNGGGKPLTDYFKTAN